MLKQNFRVWHVFLLSLAALAVGCQAHNPSHQALGAVEIRNEQVKGAWPVARPTMIYVSDFALDVAHFEADQGIGAELPGRLRGRLGQVLPHPLAKAEPEQQVEKIIAEMSRSLINGFKDKGFAAQHLSNIGSAPLPQGGWLLQGVFTEVDEGNRLKRATIGFGQGATQMEVQVSMHDLTSANPREPFIVFGTVIDPKKIPGAVITMNPYVAAAKFVLEKNATEKDIQKTAEQIVDEILKHLENHKLP